MGRTTEVMLISMVWSKGSISLNGFIRKLIKPSSTAADIPDALQPAKIIFFRLTNLTDCNSLLTTLHVKVLLLMKETRL